MDTYLEIGKTRSFAVALDWPGWCRSGRDEASALQSLFDYAPRYARVLTSSQFHFIPPKGLSDLQVVERLPGNATTDFGAPALSLARDAAPVDLPGLNELQAFLTVVWHAFDAATETASGRELRKGPRGGGRDLKTIQEHVLGAETAYLSALGGKWKPADHADPDQAASQLREVILETLAASAHGQIPARGPRGGLRWTPRYFVRRLAWHALDHAWEIEDRLV